MSSAPRSSGTDSLDTFRQQLNQSLPQAPLAPPTEAPADDETYVQRLRAALASGEPVTVGELARDLAVPLPTVLRLLRLAPETSPDQQVVRPRKAAARKPRS